MPAFAAEQVPWPTLPCSPAPDEVPTIHAARTRITAFRSSSDVLTSIRSRTKPALSTSTSSAPNGRPGRCPSRMPIILLTYQAIARLGRGMPLSTDRVDGSIGVVTVDHPSVAASPVAAWFDLAAALDDVGPEVRVVVLR